MAVLVHQQQALDLAHATRRSDRQRHKHRKNQAGSRLKVRLTVLRMPCSSKSLCLRSRTHARQPLHSPLTRQTLTREKRPDSQPGQTRIDARVLLGLSGLGRHRVVRERVPVHPPASEWRAVSSASLTTARQGAREREREGRLTT